LGVFGAQARRAALYGGCDRADVVAGLRASGASPSHSADPVVPARPARPVSRHHPHPSERPAPATRVV